MSGININLPPAIFEQEIVFKECRHNHAASLGRRSFDGCREFLQPYAAAMDGGAGNMLCAACGCHRNFHRRDIVYNPIMPEFPGTPARPSASTTRVVQFINHETTTTTMHAAAGAGGGPGDNNNNGEEVLPVPRRKRTMFTAEQRKQMLRFAERMGWRPQRSDKDEIQHFCCEMGISRRMFLVWLSNNRRRLAQPPPPPPQTVHN